jgi:hypothetical protein
MLLAAEKNDKLALIVARNLEKGFVLLEGTKGEMSIDEFKKTKMWVGREGNALCVHAKLPDGRSIVLRDAVPDRDIDEGAEVR